MFCSICSEIDKNDINHSYATEVFLGYEDDIVRTVRDDTKWLLDAVNKLHPILQFILGTTDQKNSLPFLDMLINVQPEGTIFCT